MKTKSNPANGNWAYVGLQPNDRNDPRPGDDGTGDRSEGEDHLVGSKSGQLDPLAPKSGGDTAAKSAPAKATETRPAPKMESEPVAPKQAPAPEVPVIRVDESPISPAPKN